MPQRSPYGRFVWHELMTHDPDAAVAFYTKVVGWTITPWADDPSYRQWTAPGGRTVGGVMGLPPDAERMGAPPHWLFYLSVADADAAVSEATRRGGRIVSGPIEMTGIGRFAVLNDPQGAVFAIIQASREPRREAPPQPGEFSWHELMTTDREAAWDFYRALFGWEKAGSMELPGGNLYQMFGWNGMSVGGIFNKTPDMPFPPNWVCYAMVPNADAAARRVKSAGGQVMLGPMDIPGGDRIAVCLDPHGAAFAVHSTAQVVQARPAPEPRGRPVKKAPPRRPR